MQGSKKLGPQEPTVSDKLHVGCTFLTSVQQIINKLTLVFFFIWKDISDKHFKSCSIKVVHVFFKKENI